MNKDEKEMRIREYLSGELSKAEEREFNEWLAGDMDAQRIFAERVKEFHLVRWAKRWEAIDNDEARKQAKSHCAHSVDEPAFCIFFNGCRCV